MTPLECHYSGTPTTFFVGKLKEHILLSSFEVTFLKLKRFVEVKRTKSITSNIFDRHSRMKHLKIVLGSKDSFEKLSFSHRKYYWESQTKSLSLRDFTELPKIMLANYQRRCPKDNTTHLQNISVFYCTVENHYRILHLQYGYSITLEVWYEDQL